MIPAWASVNFDFDQKRMAEEILASSVREKSVVATTIYNSSGNSVWDPLGEYFSEEIFSKNRKIHHYVEEASNKGRRLIEGSYNTFRMLNLTHHPDESDSGHEAWKGHLADKTRRPFWIEYQMPWVWREDLHLPYTRSVIESLPLAYLLTVRCITQSPPSIGVVHKDNGVKSNEEFFLNGFGSLTLNVQSGGAHLWFLNHRDHRKYKIDESRYKCWHFDDSHLHCTTEVTSPRIQLRVFGKLKVPYESLMGERIN
jgi:hypothetical protein